LKILIKVIICYIIANFNTSEVEEIKLMAVKDTGAMEEYS